MTHRFLPREVTRLFSRQKRVRTTWPVRTLVSSQFELRDAWDLRLEAPVFKQIKMAEYFVALDKKFTHEYRGSAIDVDIFANNVRSNTQAEHMEELMFKLRRTPHTLHTLPSTHHAAVRAMLDHGVTENLVKMLDDRLNYGLFFDEYSAVLTLDKLLEAGDLKAAARCSSQLMLQEENFKLANNIANIACWKYFSGGKEDPWYYPGEIIEDENPDEEIRVRVRNVPNNYTDNHFDLRDPDKLLGKTFIHLNKAKSDVVSRSLLILGHHLYGEEESVLVELLSNGEVAQQVVSHLQENTTSEQVKAAIDNVKSVDVDIEAALLKTFQDEMSSCEQKIIETQKNTYKQWNDERDAELKKQYEEMQRKARIESIEQTKKEMESTEEKLFFFDKVDGYEIEKLEKHRAWVRTLPRTDWNMKSNPMSKYYKKRIPEGQERKIARWEKREAKRGPPK